jgi:hypothetical protein
VGSAPFAISRDLSDALREHVVVVHCQELTNSIDSHMSYVSEDYSFMEGILYKKNFHEKENLSQKPSENFIVAPRLDVVPSGAVRL